METAKVKKQIENGEQKVQHHHRHIYYRPEIEKMRLLLMACSILYTYGIYLLLGDINNALFGFSFPALYIISGYLVLRKSENIEKRILRTVGRTAICFVILFSVYFVLSLLLEREATLAVVTTKKFWFDFLVLNDCNLSIGFPIWYVQALLYAYIIIYVIYKLKLLKFDIYIAALCLVVTVLTGELAGVIGFNFFGHTYLSGNFLTRALPYILIGCFIHRKKKYFADLKTKHFFIIILAGFVLSIAEYFVLGITNSIVYVSHLLGMGLVAVGISLFAFFVEGMKIKSKALNKLSRYELMIPYFVCSIIYYLLVKFVQSQNEQVVYELANLIGIITTVLSFLAMYVYIYFRSWFDNSDSDKSSSKYDDSKGYYGYKSDHHHGEHHHHHDKAVLDIGSEELSKTNTPE